MFYWACKIYNIYKHIIIIDTQFFDRLIAYTEAYTEAYRASVPWTFI